MCAAKKICLSMLLALAGLLAPSALAQSPTILIQPLSQITVPGADVTFGVQAAGTGQLSYQWMKNGADLQGETGATLTLEDVTLEDAGEYAVEVTDSLGAKVSNNARLTVGGLPQPPVITLQPIAQNVDAGGNVTFSVNATGTAPLAFQWMKDGVNIDGETGATLTLDSVTEAEAGNYSVKVSNAAGAAASAVARLEVDITDAPIITLQPLSQTVAADGTIILTVAATGDGQLRYQWKKNGANLDGKTGATLTIPNAASADAGIYSVVVTDDDGATTSSNASVTVGIDLPPSIIAQPGSQTVNAGAKVTLSATATGSGNLAYQWKRNGVNIDGATSSKLVIDSATAAHAGDYTVTVSNSAGSETSSVAKLTVNNLLAPAITAQPSSQTVSAGGSATFSASATGSGNLSYQWRKDGVNLDGETGSSLVIEDASAASEGSYSVVVSNEAGSTVSSSARLNVLTSLSGLLDLSFLANGISEVNATEILSDGKTLVAGKIEGLLGLAETGVARLNANGSADLAFSVKTDAAVRDLNVQSDGKIVIGGDFSAVNGSSHEGAARLNANGSVDSEFQVGSGANGSVESVEIQSDGKILLAGDFTSFNGAERNGLVRLNSNGSVDTSFNAGLNGSASDVDAQADGKILVAGNFTAAQGVNRDGVIRLNADGTVDTSFDAGTAADASNEVTEIEIQGDGKILVAGNFDSFNSASSAGVARLNSNGSVDATFTSGLSASSEVLTLEAQGDGKIVVGGDLSAQGAQNGSAVLRLNSNGSVDSSLNLGADGPEQIAAISLQGDGKIVIGGLDGLARIKSMLEEIAPRIMGITRAGENVEILIETEAGTTYVLESTTSLSNPQWTAVGNLSGDGSLKAFTNLATQEGNGFFRVRAE